MKKSFLAFWTANLLVGIGLWGSLWLFARWRTSQVPMDQDGHGILSFDFGISTYLIAVTLLFLITGAKSFLTAQTTYDRRVVVGMAIWKWLLLAWLGYALWISFFGE
jgi:hypothetical protein